MKNIQVTILIILLAMMAAINTSAQTVDARIKSDYGKWSLINGTNNYPNKNIFYDSLALEPAVDGSTMCTLFLNNKSSHCKHVILTYAYATSDGQIKNKSLDLLVNSGLNKYVNTADGSYDAVSFSAIKITEPFKVQLYEDSNNCK